MTNVLGCIENTTNCMSNIHESPNSNQGVPRNAIVPTVDAAGKLTKLPNLNPHPDLSPNAYAATNLKSFITRNLTDLKQKTPDIKALLFNLLESQIISTDKIDSLVSTKISRSRHTDCL